MQTHEIKVGVDGIAVRESTLPDGYFDSPDPIDPTLDADAERDILLAHLMYENMMIKFELGMI